MRILMSSFQTPPMFGAEVIVFTKLLRALADKASIEIITCNSKDYYNLDYSLLKLIEDKDILLHNIEAERELLIQQGTDKNAIGRKWLANVLRYYNTNLSENKYDILYSRSLPHLSHDAGYLLKKKLDIPWVAHFDDPWSIHPLDDRSYKDNNKWRLESEKKVLETADHFIFPNKELMWYFEELHNVSLKNKTTIIAHPIAIKLYPENKIPTNDRIVLSHIGKFFAKRTPKMLLDGIDIFLKNSPEKANLVDFLFVGSHDPNSNEIIEQYNQTHEKKIRLIEKVSYIDSLDFMLRSDVLLLVEANGVKGYFLPAKIVDYIGAKKPILSLSTENSSTTELLKNQDYYITVSPNSPQDIADGIEKIVNLLNKNRNPIIENSNLINQLLDENKANEFYDLFKNIIRKEEIYS